MLSLEHSQAAIMRALEFGPDAMPDGLFTGEQARVLAGMKVHANTISHARLVALEETFPRTLEAMGQERFNALSRLYLDQPGVTALTLAHIGAQFAAFLAGAEAERGEVDLARFEWTWLQSYHAAEAPVLRLADLAGVAPDALMELAVQAHPAASLACYDQVVHFDIGADVPGLVDAHAILITRPGAEVLVHPADGKMHAIFPIFGKSSTLGNLLAHSNEPHCKDEQVGDDQMTALVALLEAGALMLVTPV